MTPAQVRAARGYLDWTQKQLALKSNLTYGTIFKVEQGTYKHKAQDNTIFSIKLALADAGIIFVDKGIICEPQKRKIDRNEFSAWLN